MVRVRFAPSPTGNLHIGTLRTALFTWLFAKRHQGTFVLRIEDTDSQRSTSEYESNIFEGLSFMGLSYDEGPGGEGSFGPYRQSERMKEGIYDQYLKVLLEKKYAYRCFCSDEELEMERDVAKTDGRPYVYSRKCRHLSEDQVNSFLASSKPFTYRFSMPTSGSVTYTDLIRGDISFELGLVSDFVIVKSDGVPTYNFAVVVDDVLMQITHVIRGEDHISNMPRQLALFDAFEKPWPKFAHLPMILGQDRSKLSKRHGATSVSEYRDLGFLPEALFNFLTLLGWSPESEQEIFSQIELISQFGLERVSRSNAIFDLTKLKWMNKEYLKTYSDEAFVSLIQPFVSSENQRLLSTYYSSDKIGSILCSIRGNITILSDVNALLSLYVYSEEQFKEAVLSLSFDATQKQAVQLFLEAISSVETPDNASVSRALESVLSQTGFSKGVVFKAVRLALTAEGSGPHLGDIVCIFGKDRVLSRLRFVLG